MNWKGWVYFLVLIVAAWYVMVEYPIFPKREIVIATPPAAVVPCDCPVTPPPVVVVPVPVPEKPSPAPKSTPKSPVPLKKVTHVKRNPDPNCARVPLEAYQHPWNVVDAAMTRLQRSETEIQWVKACHAGAR